MLNADLLPKGSVDIAAIRAASSAPRTPATTNDSPDPSGDPPNGALALSRPQRARRPPPRDYLSDPEPASKRRKETGGLRLGRPSNPPTASASDETEPATGRQIEPETRKFPQRKKVAPKVRPMQPSTLDRLIIGIWEQIHGSISFDPQIVVSSHAAAQQLLWMAARRCFQPPFLCKGRAVACSSPRLSRERLPFLAARGEDLSSACRRAIPLDLTPATDEARLTNGRSLARRRRASIPRAPRRRWSSLRQVAKYQPSTR